MWIHRKRKNLNILKTKRYFFLKYKKSEYNKDTLNIFWQRSYKGLLLKITFFFKKKKKKMNFNIALVNKSIIKICDALRDFGISHYLAFPWSFERMRMDANALFCLHIVFIRLHKLAWHSSGSIKRPTFECHSNG